MRQLLGSELVRGSVLLFVAGNFASLGNFVYNLAMGRMLKPAVYGELEAILSLSTLAAVPLGVLSIYIVKIVSVHWGQEKYGEAWSFLVVYRRRLLVIGLVGGLILIVFLPFLERFLNLETVWPVVFLSLSFLLGGLITVNNGGLQGTLSFGYLAANGIVGIGLKLFVGVFLVFSNFQLLGALLGPLAGGLTGFLLSVFELRVVFKGLELIDKSAVPVFHQKTFWPVLLASLSLTAMLTVDVILARHFFTEINAGGFAIVAVLGKIVFYGVGPIIAVMFPLVSSRASSGRSYIIPMLGSLAATFGIGSVITFVFFMAPKLILGLLFAGKYLVVAPYLGPYAFFMILFSADSILTYFLLSVSYYRPMGLLFLISLLQGSLIILFHGSIAALIWINILVAAFYLLVASGFVIHKERYVS